MSARRQRGTVPGTESARAVWDVASFVADVVSDLCRMHPLEETAV